MKLMANITIIGKRPLLFHSFPIDTLSLEKREKSGVAGNDPEEWKRTVLMTKDKQLYINSSYVFGCLREGGKSIKQGRGSLQAKIASTLIVIEETILLDRFLPQDLTQDKTQPVYLDVRAVKNPATKAKNIRHRVAANTGWKASFQIEWDGSVVSRTQMESALKDAGDLVGLGDGRGIGFGRFTHIEFVVTEVK